MQSIETQNGTLLDQTVEDHEITITSPLITIAGTGIAGISGEGGPATQAQLNAAVGMAVDAKGNIYVLQGTSISRNIISRIDPETGFLERFAGNGQTTDLACQQPRSRKGWNQGQNRT